MRESKFRAWDGINKKWLFGYDLPELGGFSLKGEVMLFGIYTHILNSFSLSDLDKIEITEYTGLNDINGKEIYEGDIILKRGKKYLVKYDSDGFFAASKEGYYRLSDILQFDKNEIIGNIYEKTDMFK